MRFLIIALTVFIAAQTARSQGIEFTLNPKWDKVIKKAREMDKYIFVDCYTKWCGPCRKLNENVFPQKAIGEFYNQHFINVKYDMEEPNGIAFNKEYKGEVRGYPTLLYINPNTGQVVHNVVGYKTADVLIAEAQKGLNNQGLVSLQKRYDSGERDQEFMLSYAAALGDGARDQQVYDVLDELFRNGGEDFKLTDKECWELYSKYIDKLNYGYVQYIIQNRYRFYKLPYVDKISLENRIKYCVYAEMKSLFSVRVQEKEFSYVLPIDDDKLALVKSNLKSLRSLQNLEYIHSLVYIYELLKNEQWEKAYYAMNAAVGFKFPYARNGCLDIFAYIVQECDDKHLLAIILKRYKELQEERKKEFRDYNIYGYIALTADKLGLKKEAKEARKTYEILKEKRIKQFAKMKERAEERRER
ncbi:thioredoxin family protein [Carboxylicivirga sp. RSCT41]|uniref:thioredoxin family protein n=1 Tax=Carboxylicivirga agarovorans TaxID=3417570 RepID=UPI003D3303A9